MGELDNGERSVGADNRAKKRELEQRIRQQIHKEK